MSTWQMRWASPAPILTVTRSKKRKPAARRGRKAHGPLLDAGSRAPERRTLDVSNGSRSSRTFPAHDHHPRREALWLFDRALVRDGAVHRAGAQARRRSCAGRLPDRRRGVLRLEGALGSPRWPGPDAPGCIPARWLAKALRPLASSPRTVTGSLRDRHPPVAPAGNTPPGRLRGPRPPVGLSAGVGVSGCTKEPGDGPGDRSGEPPARVAGLARYTGLGPRKHKLLLGGHGARGSLAGSGG